MIDGFDRQVFASDALSTFFKASIFKDVSDLILLEGRLVQMSLSSI